MNKHNVMDIPGTEFPAGRRTRVMVGPSAPLEAEHFVMGHVTIFPGGAVPLHDHPQEEVYFIVSGSGEFDWNGETQPVKSGDYLHITPGSSHQLRNTGTEDMVMVFCYAPKAIVEHWRQELSEGRQAVEIRNL